jgi:hypothetical protein
MGQQAADSSQLAIHETSGVSPFPSRNVLSGW